MRRVYQAYSDCMGNKLVMDYKIITLQEKIFIYYNKKITFWFIAGAACWTIKWK